MMAGSEQTGLRTTGGTGGNEVKDVSSGGGGARIDVSGPLYTSPTKYTTPDGVELSFSDVMHMVVSEASQVKILHSICDLEYHALAFFLGKRSAVA